MTCHSERSVAKNLLLAKRSLFEVIVALTKRFGGGKRTRNQKLETGNWKLETGNWHPISSFQFPISSFYLCLTPFLFNNITALSFG